MKALIISDVHSNIYALEAIWAQERDSDRIYCAGDLVDYGPYPKEVLDWVRAHNVTCVQGNHDLLVTYAHRSGQAIERLPVAERAWVHHNASLLDEAAMRFLVQLPLAVTFDSAGVTYGMAHLYRDYEEIRSLHAFEQFRGSTFSPAVAPSITRLIFGHTHRQSIRYLSDTLLWMNPGSASYRRLDDPDQTAHYMTIVDGALSLRRIEYDRRPLYRSVCQTSLKDSEREVAEWFFGPREG
jgi:predicted phosphodiesterase